MNSLTHSTGRHRNAKVYTCDVCFKEIKTSKYNFQLHKYTHTGEKRKSTIIVFSFLPLGKIQNSEEFDRMCFSPSVYFTTAFKCTYCDARYTQSADLNKHLRKHIGPNTYKCDRCDKSFRLLRELRKHASEHYIESLTGERNDDISNVT